MERMVLLMCRRRATLGEVETGDDARGGSAGGRAAHRPLQRRVRRRRRRLRGRRRRIALEIIYIINIDCRVYEVLSLENG